MSDIQEKRESGCVSGCGNGSCNGGVCVNVHRFCFHRCCVIKCLSLIVVLGVVFALGYLAGVCGNHHRYYRGYEHNMMYGSGWDTQSQLFDERGALLRPGVQRGQMMFIQQVPTATEGVTVTNSL